MTASRAHRERSPKKVIVFILCAAIFLQSCTSMSPLARTEYLPLLRAGDGPLTLKLSDGRSLILESGRYLLVDEPGDFFYGEGTFLNYRDNREHPFHGAYSPSKIIRDTAGQGSDKVLCWRNDTSAVVFHRGNYVEVSHRTGTGLYVFGRTEPIPTDSILHVEAEKVSAQKTHQNISLTILTAPIWVPLTAWALREFFKGWFGLHDE